MRQKINLLGGDLHRDNIRCRRCHNPQAGGFDPNYGIVLCANNLRDRSEVEDTLAHGMRDEVSEEM